MSLERNDLREELAAIIAASRELPPEHDRALADIFLDHAGFRASQAQPSAATIYPWQDWRVLAGAMILAMSAFLFGSTLAHSADHRFDNFYGGYGFRGDGDGDQGMQQQVPWNDNWPSFHQAPQPQSPSGPGA